MTTREKIIELVAANPAITKPELRDATGVTRQRVQQIINTAGLSVPSAVVDNRPVCAGCDKRVAVQNHSGTCRTCLKDANQVFSNCEWCGKPTQTTRGILSYAIRRGSTIGRFCSHSCFGKFAGHQYGFGAGL